MSTWAERNPEKHHEMHKAAKRRYYQRNKEQLKEEARQRRKDNPNQHRTANKRWLAENIEARKQYRLEYRTKNADKFKEYDRQKWLRELKQQEEKAGRPKPDVCDHCRKPGRIFYDHDHQTNQFRSWVCHQCNSSMGWVKDDSALLRRLADCIDAHKAQYGNQIQLQDSSDTS